MISDSTSHKRWLPCRAWDFESLMCPCVFFSKLFGYFPYKYQNDKYEISTTRLAFAVFVVCFSLVSQIYVLYAVNLSDPNDSITGTLSENFLALLDGSIPMAMLLTTYSRSLMFQRVTKVSRILSPQDFNDMAKFQHITNIMNFLYNMLFVLIFYLDKQNIPVTRRYMNLIIVLTSFEGVLFYLNCVCVVGACFEKVNKSLKRLRDPSTNRRSESTGDCLPRKRGAMLLMKVKYYEDVHEEISDVVEHLNESSRSVYICFTAGTFVLVTFNVYISMQWISAGDVLSVNSYWFYECCSYGMLRLTQFVLLIWVSETAMNPATEINTTIYDLANNCTDDAVKRELKYFALQVVHRDNAITATVFKINGKLLSQVLSGIVMYVMILFEFLIGSNCSH